MQVDTHRNSLLTPSALAGGTIRQSAAIAGRQNMLDRKVAGFPDQPLISAQPLRYNVQLNQQLTHVQQADHFLQRTEKQVLQLNHAITRRAPIAEVQGQAEALQQLLTFRQQLSGGTVSRQLQVSLEARPQVKFTLRDGNTLLNNPQPEVLTFSLAGQKREVSAASLPAASSARQALLTLNQALGKWGIYGSLDSQRQVSFQVAEQDWARIDQHLSVKGGGERYPENQFFPVKPQMENGLEDDVQRFLKTPSVSTARQLLPCLDNALTTLSQQRRGLQRSKAAVQMRIESMATFSGSDTAQAASRQLAQQLNHESFAQLTQALAAQANVHCATVRNVLAQSQLSARAA
ncbi:hypothetical protein [Pantoea sp. B65]|uniref:hypothetical protein n=1 Tax=Pantoea sp. B65 TaxID=2813359 RepID=UPI0039B50173